MTCHTERPHIREGPWFSAHGAESPYLLPSEVTPDGSLQALIFSCSLFSPEQHAVQELTKAAMSGVGIDGEVLSYLELAQVCSTLPFTFSVYSTSSFNADKTFHCCIWTNKDVTTESQKPPAVCSRKDLRVLSCMHCSPCWASFEKTTRALPPHQPLCALPLQRQQLHMWENSSGHGRGRLCLLFEFSDTHWLRSDSF